jgi:uncharacterized protein (TIGR03067 family)
MMTRGVAVLAAAVLLAADAKDGDKKAGDGIQGTWVIVSVEIGGKKVDPEAEQGLPQKITFADGDVTMTAKQGEHKGKYELGKDGDLRTLDLIPSDPDKKGQRTLCLYQVEGDTLRICAEEKKRAERPKELAAKEGTTQALLTFKREKK